MKSSIILKNSNKGNYLIKRNPEEIFKNIFGIEGEIKIVNNTENKELYINNEKICNFNINYHKGLYELYDYIIEIYYNNYFYRYYCDDNGERLNAKLGEYSFNRKNKEYHIVNSCSVTADIIEGNKGISIDVEDSNIDMKSFEVMISSLDFEDSLKSIYNKLSLITNCENLKIKKYNKLNTCDYREKITDLLVIKYGEIQEYIADVVVDIGDKERNFVFSKNNNNYSITFNNGSIEDFTSSYFLANEQVEFIKKIEQKQKKLSRTIK